MLKYIAPALVGLALLCLVPVVAMAESFFGNAQLPCDKTQSYMKTLTKKYGEKPVMQGVSPDGILVQLWVGPKGSFTVLRINPRNGISCSMAGGSDWGDDVTNLNKDKGI